MSKDARRGAHGSQRAGLAALALILIAPIVGACGAPGGTETDGGVADAPVIDAAMPVDAALPPAPPEAFIDVPLSGPYGTRTFDVHAGTNWFNTGLFLRAGETATISATGTWSLAGVPLGPEGGDPLDIERMCTRGSLVARSGLKYEGPITCIGAGAELVAPIDGIVYVGMIPGNDFGEIYGSRLAADGALSVTVTSTGDTAPMIRIEDLAATDVASITSGMLELVGAHIIVATTTADLTVDLATARAAIETLDAVWEEELDLRGIAPFRGQRIRFVEDDDIERIPALMLASNPIRCAGDVLHGDSHRRIFRAGVPSTDIFGFSHEIGHAYSMADGISAYQYNNLEVFPNVFALYAITEIHREAYQPVVETYCDGRDAYLAGGTLVQFRADPMLELCFLSQFTTAYGWDFWRAFYASLAGTRNLDIPPGDGTWGFLRDRFSAAAGEDVTPIFEAWRLPVP